MPKFIVNLEVPSPNSQRSTYRDAHAVPSIFWRCGAKPREQRFRSSSLAKKTNVEVRDITIRLSIDNNHKIFLSPRASSRSVRLLLSADCSDCADHRSGPRLADPTISPISELRKTTKRCQLKCEGTAQTKMRWSLTVKFGHFISRSVVGHYVCLVVFNQLCW